MKHYQRIRLRKDGVPPAVFQAACELWPAGFKTSICGDEFNYECFIEDEDANAVAQKIIGLCQAASLPQSRIGGPSTYGHEVVRVYDDDDYRSSELLLLRRQREIQLEHERDAQGRLLLIASKAKPSIKLGRIWANWIIVSDKVKKLLETQDFKGLEFGEVALKGKSIHAAKEPFWELKSSIVLPLMANTHEFIHPGVSAPEPFRGDFSKIIMLQGPPLGTGEVHYRKPELASLLPFDVALTFEHFIEPHPALIVSQRFYQFCLKNKIPLNVQPVRIDSD